MGFIDAVMDLGRTTEVGDCDRGEFGAFLQLPMPVIEDDERSGRVIRVWLKVKDPDGPVLDVDGVSRMDVVDYLSGEGDVEAQKERYMYRDPVGAAARWSFSPVYKLGKPKNDSDSRHIDFLGSSEELTGWRDDKNTRFLKLKNRVLDEFENCGLFAQGSVDRIFGDLESSIDRLVELWADPKRSYLLVFGVVRVNGGKEVFSYPGEVPAFRAYFADKFAEVKGSKKGKGDGGSRCALCGCRSSSSVNISKVFSFATFDKVSFLPGVEKGADGKVFPICMDCFAALSSGRELLDRSFTDGRTIRGMNIYIAPELTLGVGKLSMASNFTKDFIRNGLKVEDKVFNKLAKQKDSLVFHFLFWEKNQAQEIVHLMVEDVPPSRLKILEALWAESYRLFLWSDKKGEVFDPTTVDLDMGLKILYGILISLSGKNDQDKKVMTDWAVDIIGKLLSGEVVDVMGVKQLMVSRLYGLCSNSEWMRFGGSEVRKMAAVVDFLVRANGR